MQTLGSPASVLAAIREDAVAEAERLRDATAAELQAIRAEAEAFSVVIADREARLQAVRRTSEERLAKQEWEGRRAAIEQREVWIERVVEQARARFAITDALLQEARSHLPPGPVHVEGGVVTAGNLSFDNSFDARARRLEPEWRNALSRMYVP
jgi:vacuolar-type H+-ATPase subunit E/Vma4